MNLSSSCMQWTLLYAVGTLLLSFMWYYTHTVACKLITIMCRRHDPSVQPTMCSHT